MSARAVAARLPGDRLHLQHGPIDLIIDIDADPEARSAAQDRAIEAFDGVLPDLMQEVSLLRQPISESLPVPQGAVAKRMRDAAWRCAAHTDYLTSMAAVAGCVADHVLAAVMQGDTGAIRRVAVNNGGDIAVRLTPGTAYRVGLVADLGPTTTVRAGFVVIDHSMGVGGVATSGWPGRSFCRGIADAVTVLAAEAGVADCAATVIAGAVDIDAPERIERAPAESLAPDSDLGTLPVTVAVRELSAAERADALANGERVAQQMLADGLITAAWIHLQGDCVVISNWHDRAESSQER